MAIVEQTFHGGACTRDVRHDRTNRVHSSCDIRDRVFGAGRPLDIGEEEDPAFSLEPAPQFPGNTGLAHAPLSGEKHVVSIPDPVFQYLQLGLPVKKIAAADPAARR